MLKVTFVKLEFFHRSGCHLANSLESGQSMAIISSQNRLSPCSTSGRAFLAAVRCTRGTCSISRVVHARASLNRGPETPRATAAPQLDIPVPEIEHDEESAFCGTEGTISDF